MIKLNLDFDANYLLMKDVFILHKLKTLYGDLETLLINDYNKITTSFPFDAIYFIADSKRNWRKTIYPEYKGKRKKDLDIDWDFVFDTFDKFKEYVNNKPNCNLYQIDPFEGDDLIAHIVTESNKNGSSNIIISNDSDLQQLLEYNVNKDYINMIYNYKFNDEKIYVPENYKIFLQHIEDTTDGDIFNLNNDIEFLNYFDTITNRAKIIQINKEESYFKKIVAGDKGDNILSVVKFNENIRGIAEDGANNVYKLYKQKYPEYINFDSDDFINNLSEILAIYRKNTEPDFKYKVITKIIESRKLTRLDGKYLPINYKNILYNNIKIK